MADIGGYVNQIRTARYGEEVRDSIADAIVAINTGVEQDTNSARSYAESAAADAEHVDTINSELTVVRSDIGQTLDEYAQGEAAREAAEASRAAAEEIRQQNEQSRQDTESGYVQQAKEQADRAENIINTGDYVKVAKNWAVGSVEDSTPSSTNNSKYWSNESKRWADLAQERVVHDGVSSFSGIDQQVDTGDVVARFGHYSAEQIRYPSTASASDATQNVNSALDNVMSEITDIQASIDALSAQISRAKARVDSASGWSSINPVLDNKEIAFECYDSSNLGVGPASIKIGNGTDRWNDIGYAIKGTQYIRRASGEEAVDLDDYVEEGRYYFSVSSTSQLLNAPYASGSGAPVNGWLEVLASDPDTSQHHLFKQVWSRAGSNPTTFKEVYIRLYASGSFGNWEKVATESTVAPINHASTTSTYGLATSSNYGHTKVINNLTTGSYADGVALSAYQGKVLKDSYGYTRSYGGSALDDSGYWEYTKFNDGTLICAIWKSIMVSQNSFSQWDMLYYGIYQLPNWPHAFSVGPCVTATVASGHDMWVNLKSPSRTSPGSACLWYTRQISSAMAGPVTVSLIGYGHWK